MDRPAANKDVNWIKRGQHSVSVTTFTSGGANHGRSAASDSKQADCEHNDAVHSKVRSESGSGSVKATSKRIFNIPVVNVSSKPLDNVSSDGSDYNYEPAVGLFVRENVGSSDKSRSRFRATSEPPPTRVTRVIPICLEGSSGVINNKEHITGSRSSTNTGQVQGKQKIYTSGVYQECVPVKPSAGILSSSISRDRLNSKDRSRFSSNESTKFSNTPDSKSINLSSHPTSRCSFASAHPFSPPSPKSSTTVEVQITRTGNPVRVLKSRPYTGKAREEESTEALGSGAMHGGGIHSTDQRSATFVSSISVRDAAKPPPIPASMLGSVHGGNLSDGNGGSIYWHQGGGSRALTSPVGVSIPSLSSEQRSIIIGGQRYPAPKAPLMNTSGQSHQISVQYQSVYQSAGPSGYSSPRSSIGSGGGDSQGNSIASSPRSSLANAAALYEQRRFGGSPRSSLALANPSHSNRSGWTVQMVEASSSRQMTGSPHDPRLSSSSSLSISPHQHPSVISMGTRGNNVPLQLLPDNRFSEPGPPPPPSHIYTDPRQRTLPAQTQSAVSLQTSSRIASSNNNVVAPYAIGEQRGTSSLQNGVSVPSGVQTSGVSPMSTPNTVSAPSPPPVLPARVPLNYRNVAQQHMLNRQGEADAEMTVAALTQQLERDMTLSSTGKKAPPDPSPSEPPPPYHGPHDVQTSIKHAVVTPNPVQTPGPSVQPAKPNVRLVAPVQGIQIQPPASSGAAPSPQSRGAHVSPGGLKSQLAFQVTPPKTSGPSDAERKLAALTQQLEDEMEQTSGDYFGKHLLFY